MLSPHKETVYISIYNEGDKDKAPLHDPEELSNIPYILLGSGLPNDDDDDEDFALDLQQFNEPRAFERFIFDQEDAEDEEDDVSVLLTVFPLKKQY